MELFVEMKLQSPTVRPNSVTFLNLMSAIVRCRAETEHYVARVDILASAGHSLDAVYLLKGLPPALVWGALLGACAISGEGGFRAAPSA